MAIQSFSDKSTELFFTSGIVARKTGWAYLEKIARRKLDILHFAKALNDLRVPPGNRLEALNGTLNGYYSIRINNQWRIVIKWSEDGPTAVRICDYH